MLNPSTQFYRGKLSKGNHFHCRTASSDKVEERKGSFLTLGERESFTKIGEDRLIAL